MRNNMIEQNIIITESCTNLRMLGRNALAGKWKVTIIAMIIYVLVLNFPPTVFDALFGLNPGSVITGGETYGLDVNTYSAIYNNMPTYSLLSAIYVMLIAGSLELGQCILFLAAFRKHDIKATDIFLGFERFGKALMLLIYQTVFIMLWTFLLIIPGIIAAYRYSQAFYILADDPDKSIKQCMDESKAMMRGNKWKRFVLELSYIGWLILAYFPAAFFNGIGQLVTDNTFVLSVISIIASLFTVPVSVYMMSSFAGFYEILAGHLIKETKPVPVTVQEAIEMKHKLEQLPEATEETPKAVEEPEVSEAPEDDNK